MERSNSNAVSVGEKRDGLGLDCRVSDECVFDLSAISRVGSFDWLSLGGRSSAGFSISSGCGVLDWFLFYHFCCTKRLTS